MEVKGTAVLTIPLFVSEKHGDQGYKRWMDSLSSTAKQIFERAPLASAWYQLEPAVIEPTKKLCELFYGGSSRGAWESGRYSADHGLKGIYKLFVQLGSPQFIIKKASTILPTYYKDSVMAIGESGKNNTTVQIVKFSAPNPLIEARIGGWMERALEICGCKGLRIQTKKSLTKGDTMTEIDITWT